MEPDREDQTERLEDAPKLIRRGRKRKALEILERLAQESPKDPVVATHLLTTQIGLKHTHLDEAQRRLRVLIASSPEAIEPRILDAWITARKGHRSTAIGWLRDYRERFGPHQWLNALLGSLLAAEERFEEAWEHFRAAHKQGRRFSGQEQQVALGAADLSGHWREALALLKPAMLVALAVRMWVRRIWIFKVWAVLFVIGIALDSAVPLWVATASMLVLVVLATTTRCYFCAVLFSAHIGLALAAIVSASWRDWIIALALLAALGLTEVRLRPGLQPPPVRRQPKTEGVDRGHALWGTRELIRFLLVHVAFFAICLGIIFVTEYALTGGQTEYSIGPDGDYATLQEHEAATRTEGLIASLPASAFSFAVTALVWRRRRTFGWRWVVLSALPVVGPLFFAAPATAVIANGRPPTFSDPPAPRSPPTEQD